MSLEWWHAGDAAICLYVDRRQENDALLRQLFKKWSPSAVYFGPEGVVGYHFRLGEGVSALDRLGIRSASKYLE